MKLSTADYTALSVMTINNELFVEGSGSGLIKALIRKLI
jgi:hypothetical protein